ncbi:hypothetical protein J6590_016801 [Homalodisca vitripennis]|nr:hypothetical protein J6590_016801 [Homalodisca vitripennis]
MPQTRGLYLNPVRNNGLHHSHGECAAKRSVCFKVCLIEVSDTCATTFSPNLWTNPPTNLFFAGIGSSKTQKMEHCLTIVLSCMKLSLRRFSNQWFGRGGPPAAQNIQCLQHLNNRITDAITTVSPNKEDLDELEFRFDVCRAIGEAHIETNQKYVNKTL